MIVDIRELVIKATVVPAPQQNALTPAALEQWQKKLVDECILQVLEHLQTNAQR